MRNLWERLQSAKRRESGIGRPYTSYDDMMVWAREQQAEVEVETCSAGAQHIEPSPEGGGSGRDDGIARPGHGWPNQSPSEDRATGHDEEIVSGDRGRLRGGGERGGPGEVEEEPTRLDGGWCGGCSGGPGPSQLGPGTKRSRAGSWTLDGRQQFFFVTCF